MSLLWVILGFLLLVIGGEFLVRSSVALSFKFNLSKLVIGMTVVSFATSAEKNDLPPQSTFQLSILKFHPESKQNILFTGNDSDPLI